MDEKSSLREFLESDDALFHYTKTSSAIKILSEKKLKFSTFSNSNDPFEYSDKEIVTCWWGFDGAIKKSEKVRNEVQKIIESELFFSSFCENSFENKKLVVEGFKKPRMWAQYGETHRGVCLVFSKKELKKRLVEKEINNICKILFSKRIIYKERLDCDYPHLDIKDTGNYDAKEEAWEYIEKNIGGLIGQKPLDYKDENEYRLALRVLKKDMFEGDSYKINIKDVLKGVFIGDKCISEDIKKIEKFCGNNDVALLTLYWSDGDFRYFRSL